jgi:hypothetical protein
MLMAWETLLGVWSGYTEPWILCSIGVREQKSQSSEQTVGLDALIALVMHFHCSNPPALDKLLTEIKVLSLWAFRPDHAATGATQCCNRN